MSPNEPTTPALPDLPRERWPALLAGGGLVAGLALIVLAIVAVAGDGSGSGRLPAPPAAPNIVVATPTAAVTGAAEAAAAAAAERETVQRVASPLAERQDLRRFAANDRAHVRADWVARFYPIYEIAQREFGVNWLLIASVHKQETAFSTHPTTYHGLNFARCCAGPMQFNVTNGPVTTWARYRDSFRQAGRPAGYPHVSRRHPSIYDDFDAIMAGAALLRDSGAGAMLDGSAWQAAYDYYGHDATGVAYADEVVARAIGWGQRRFCINCATDERVRAAVDAVWGAPARAALTPATPPKRKHRDRGARAKPDARALAAERRQPARDR